MSTVADPEDVTMDVPALLGALAQRWLRIFLVTAVVLVGCGLALALLPKTYDSSASLLVEPRDSIYTRAAGEAAPQSSGTDMEALMSSQIELIKSRDLLMDVVESEKLRSVAEFAGAPFSPLGFLMQLAGRRGEARGLDEVVLDNLASHMTVIRERDSAVISVYVRSTDPALAARIANAVAEAHVKRRAAQSVADTADATVWLQQEIDKLRSSVQAAETRVADYRIANDLFVGANSTPVSDQQLSTIASQIADAQQKQAAAEARAEMIRGLLASGQSLEGVSDVRDSVVVQRLLETKGNLQSELAQKSTTLLSNHPTIKSLKAQIAEIGTQIVAEGRKIANALDAEADVEADLVKRLKADMTSAKVTASDATRGNVTLDSLEREAKAQRDLLETYLARYSDAMSRSSANSALPDVRVVSVAAASVEPSSPKTGLVLGAVGLVTLLFQVGAVLFGELMSGRALSARNTTALEEDDDVDEWHEDVEIAASADAPGLRTQPPGDLGRVIDSLLDGRLRIVLVAGSGETADRVDTIETLLDEVLAAGLSAVTVDAGSGDASPDAGLSDLSLERADYGDVVHPVADNLAHVPWGHHGAIDRRSVRPMTLIEALSDIYHVVLVDTGVVGLASNLTLFGGVDLPVVLVASSGANPVTIAAARRDVAALGFVVAGVIEPAAARAEVA